MGLSNIIKVIGEIRSISRIFFGIFLLLIAFILSAGVFLFDWFNSVGNYFIPVSCLALGYILITSGILELLQKKKHPGSCIFLIIFWGSLVLIFYLLWLYAINQWIVLIFVNCMYEKGVISFSV